MPHSPSRRLLLAGSLGALAPIIFASTPKTITATTSDFSSTAHETQDNIPESLTFSPTAPLKPNEGFNVAALAKQPWSAPMTRLPGEGRYIAWTVDDGVSPETIRAYAEFAARTGVRLTFFVNMTYVGFTQNVDALSMPVRAVRRVWPPLCRNSYWRGLLRYGAGKRYPAPVPTRSNAYLPLPGNVRAEPSAQNNVWQTKRTNRFSTANVPLPHVPMPSRRKWMCRAPLRPSKPATAVWRDSKYKPFHSLLLFAAKTQISLTGSWESAVGVIGLA